MAVAKIAPKFIDGVADGVGDIFDFSQLDAVLYRCTGERKINDYTNEKLPKRKVARDCIDGAEKDGILVVFLANILSALSEAAPLYTLIVQAMPDARNALPGIQSQLADVRTGLERTRILLGDPTARASIAQSKTTLEGVDYGISLLDGYKGLHDCLHLLQIKQISLLLASSATIASDDAQYDALREYIDQVRTQVESAKIVAERLPQEPTLRSIEAKWIAELGAASQFLQKALDDRKPSMAKIGIIKMSRVLQFQPPRLNDLIVAAAQQIPLQQLAAALGGLAGGSDNGTADLGKAQAAIGNMDQAMRARVAEHDMWQEIDKQIWILEQLFPDTVDPTDTFTAAWPDFKKPLLIMADLSPESAWARNLKDFADRIDVELLRLQALDGTPMEGRPKWSLPNLFARIRSEARLRFFFVDLQLKRDCELLVSIGAPLKTILGILDNG